MMQRMTDQMLGVQGRGIWDKRRALPGEDVTTRKPGIDRYRLIEAAARLPPR
jgi:hypothetical protein